MILLLEGRLSDDGISEVLRVVESWHEGSGQGGLTLDLAGVSWVDQNGVRLLRKLIDGGAAIRGASPFIAQLVAQVFESQVPARDR